MRFGFGFAMSLIRRVGAFVPPALSLLLTEAGFDLLLEDGGSIILE